MCSESGSRRQNLEAETWEPLSQGVGGSQQGEELAQGKRYLRYQGEERVAEGKSGTGPGPQSQE